MSLFYIDVWWVPFSTSPLMDNVLSGEEHARADRFHFAEHCRRFRICHAALRLILAPYTGQPAKAIQFSATPLGKPFIVDRPRVSFNLSHSDTAAVIAVTDGIDVGVDVEEVRFEPRVLEMLSCFTMREQALLVSAKSEHERTELFFRFWTRKEAVLKADGCGLRHALNRIDVARGGDVSVPSGSRSHRTWRVEDLHAAQGIAAAVAAPPGDWRVRWRQ